MQLNTASYGELTFRSSVLLAKGIPSRLLRVERGGGVATACFAPELAQTPVRARGAKLLGIKYERCCQEELSDEFGSEYVASPFLRYTTLGDTARHYGCIPDGLHIDWDNRQVTIIEMKLKYTTEADWQVQSLYKPIVRRLFPSFHVRAVVLCKYTDPSVSSPFNIKPTESVVHFIKSSSGPYGLARRVA